MNEQINSSDDLENTPSSDLDDATTDVPTDVFGDYDIDINDIMIPQAVEYKEEEIKDKFDSGFKFSFIGTGQGGSRLAETFYKIGYRRVGVVNTAEQDLATIDLPPSNKFCFGQGGAGKDRGLAKNLFKGKQEDCLDFTKRVFGKKYDRTIVCAGAGGGTGAGTLSSIVKVARDLQISNKCSSDKVGVILALPKYSEGKKVNENACKTLTEALDLVDQGIVSPFIVLDNEKIGHIYPNLSIDRFWHTANMSICTLFHLFNTIITRNSHYSTFDPNDYSTILDSGTIVFGATNVNDYSDETKISYAIRENLKQNILSGGFDIGTGTVAAAVVIGKQDALATIPEAHLDYAFEQLTRTLKADSTVHRGIYRGNKPGLNVFTAIGGLARPTTKLEDLKNLSDN